MTKTANIQGTKGHSVTVGLPRYELVDKDGRPWRNLHFPSAVEAALCAASLWPDQQQDEDRTGKGWDIQVATD